MAARFINNHKTRNTGYVEHAAQLDIRDLRRLGLLQEGAICKFASPENPHNLIIANLKDPDHAYIELKNKDNTIKVDLVGRPAKFGGRRWFLLDENLRPREILYPVGSRLLSRAGARLSYRSQSMGHFDRLLDERKKVIRALNGCESKGPARGRNRQRLLERKAELDLLLYGPE